MEYVTIYNILDEGVIFPEIVIPLIICFLFLYFIPKYVSNKLLKYIFWFIMFVTFIMIILTYIKKLDLREIYKTRNYKIVEGVVESYIPEVKKKNLESFTVNGIKFSIGSYVDNGGFHKTGKVYNGLKVKIYYTGNEDDNNIILRLDRER